VTPPKPPIRLRRGAPQAGWALAALLGGIAAAGWTASATAPVRADDPGDRFAVAAGLYDRQQWKLAIDEFRALLQEHPQHPQAGEAVFYLGEALLQAGQTAEAGDHFRAYLERESDGKWTRQALFRAGETAYRLGDTDQARADLERFLAAYPDDRLGAYVLPYLGEMALGRGEAADAERYFRQALEKHPQGRLQDDCRFGLARALERLGKPGEAERFYAAVASKVASPLAGDAQFHLGALQYASGRYEEAVETFAALEQTFPESPWRTQARLGRGWALLKLRRRDEAKAVFASLASDAQHGLEARHWLGLTEKAAGEYAAAAATLREAARAAAGKPIEPAVRFHAGDALLRSGDAAGAVAEFDAVIALGDGDHEWLDDALCGKVRAALAQGDHARLDREAAEFQRRSGQSPLRADVHRMVARSLLERQRYDEAAALLEPLAAADPQTPRALEDRYLLAVAREGQQRYEDALAALGPVVEAATGRLQADARLRQGSALRMLGRFAEAIGPLASSLEARGEGEGAVKARGELAICYARTGQLDKAKEHYAELLRRHADDRLMPAITEQLAEAAYEADDPAWAEDLFARLAGRPAAVGAERPGGEPTFPTEPTVPTEPDAAALLGLAWSQFKGGRLAEAAATFGQVIDADPPTAMLAEAALTRGRIFQRLERHDAALAMFDLVVERCPESPLHPEALFAAGQLRDELGQDREAAALYQRLAADYPDFDKRDAVLYLWAWALRDLGDRQDAETTFERLRAEFPGSRYTPDATYRLAEAAFAAKDHAKAEGLLAEVLSGESDPRVRQYACYLQAQIAVTRQDWPNVQAAFETFTAEFPESPQRLVADFWIAESLYRRREYDEAGTRFDDLARRAAGRRDAWLGMVPLRRAQVLAQKRQWAEALALGSRIAENFPNFEQQFEADYVVGRSLAALARFDEAREALGRVIDAPAARRTETEAMARWMIGETYFFQKNYEAAIREFIALEVLCALPTWQAAALFEAGRCRELLGERDEAMRLFTRIVKVYPDTAAAALARQRLETPPGGGD
jgi:cellulose synthase operon protein C